MNEILTRNAAKRVRAIRNRQYEETKDMSREEQQAHARQRIDKSVAEFEKRMADTQPDYDHFPFLRKNGKPNA